ncbi:MAG: Gfo/Idh/MocA family oxidoreductase [Candidatus Marinimicrobia bacterium]|nr:Gfo/Idh/MocA family oxidoreductase [Candidatus Neomarinimicrobiota bacterium]
MKKTYNWGIIGTGRISNLFTEALTTLDSAKVYAVGSRAEGSARNFAEHWAVPRAYSSYADVYNDQEVEIVYIGTPHNFHFQNVKDALNAGKHVICEKPLTINAQQARILVDLARQKGLFLMEAMWNRFQPWYAVVKELIDNGSLGQLHHFKADLSFRFDVGPEHRIFNPNLAGGALLDLGVYPIALAALFLGKPAEIMSSSHMCETGVDDQVTMIFNYASGATADLGCSSRYLSKNNATLHGTKGFIEIHGMIIRPEKISYYQQGENAINIETPYISNGYQYEAQAVMDMLQEGAIEHPAMPLSESLEIMETMDIIRAQMGLVYPDE